MKRKHKNYSRPKRPFDKVRIDEEKEIKKEFGLKNKKEIWKTESKIKSIREKAKKLISANKEQQLLLFDKLKKIGIEVNSIADVLGLEKKDYLKRRLQTILVKNKLVTTTKSARQLITHKKVLVDGKVIDSPSYIVPIKLENKISLKVKKKKEVKIEEVVKENKEEVKEGEKQNE
ncbi:MAG: 30S ribosomal protein S4 [Nanoarchaeota archaeon]